MIYSGAVPSEGLKTQSLPIEEGAMDSEEELRAFGCELFSASYVYIALLDDHNLHFGCSPGITVDVLRLTRDSRIGVYWGNVTTSEV